MSKYVPKYTQTYKKKVSLGIVAKKEKDRWFEVKQVLKFASVPKVRGDPAGESQRKSLARKERVKLFNSNKLFEEFFTWFNFVRVKFCRTYNKRNIHFAKAVGIKRSALKTYRLWHSGSGGYFPSDELIKRVEALEKQLKAEVKTVNEDYRIRHKKKVIRMIRTTMN